ncbi:Fatty acid-binding protein [Mactra antiquata]
MAAEVGKIFGGSWKLDRSENFEAFLEAAGVGFLKKKLATSVSPSMVITVDGDNIEVKTSAGPKTIANKFQLGREFESDTEYPAMATATLEGNKWVIQLTPKDSKKKNQKVTREIIDGELVQTMEIGDIAAKRIFKKA